MVGGRVFACVYLVGIGEGVCAWIGKIQSKAKSMAFLGVFFFFFPPSLSRGSYTRLMDGLSIFFFFFNC